MLPPPAGAAPQPAAPARGGGGGAGTRTRARGRTDRQTEGRTDRGTAGQRPQSHPNPVPSSCPLSPLRSRGCAVTPGGTGRCRGGGPGAAPSPPEGPDLERFGCKQPAGMRRAKKEHRHGGLREPGGLRAVQVSAQEGGSLDDFRVAVKFEEISAALGCRPTAALSSVKSWGRKWGVTDYGAVSPKGPVLYPQVVVQGDGSKPKGIRSWHKLPEPSGFLPNPPITHVPPCVQLLSPHSPIPATFPTPFSFFPLQSLQSLRLFHTWHRGPELLAVIKKKKLWDPQGSDELGHFQLLIPSAPIHVTDYSGHRASWSVAAPNAPVLLLGDATRGNENDFLCNSWLHAQRLSCLFNFLL